MAASNQSGQHSHDQPSSIFRRTRLKVLHGRFGLSDLRVGLMRRGQIVARIDFHQQISGL
jgi:hypothetical protein